MTTTPWRRAVAALATAAILPFALSACGDDSSGGDDDKGSSNSSEDKSDDAADAAADDAAADAESQLEELEESSGVDVETGGDLPEGFPEDDIPLVGQVEQGAAIDTPGAVGWSVATSYDGAKDAALTEASEALTEAGFDEQTAGAIPDGALFAKGDYSVTVAVVEDGSGSTLISYAVAQLPS
ncbi:hypothetical protein ACFQ0K_14830 [Nocardioides caeni]|uniref:Uncharacterized protein n=1 Tax=Nocardioides caeni TaxID=574700 RepID=A0A4S8NFA4_9ACTN|nr:hypothetical protein [Nocardioides caeni]THV14642.1 hypothetical protein E9934_08240 [Nocardioides caeni]